MIISFRRSFHPSTEPYSTRSKNQLWCSSRNTIQFLTHVECESSSSGVVEHDLWHDAKRAISRALCQGPRQLLSKLAADQISQPCTLFAELV
ncbi:uncharacterized protein [Physcomitrium patens]|uniref:uncharacterized protein isoform X2 n=1 Tax=Physcomitrium patens TaxID=3218 RepID=UPI003CCE1523